MEYTFTFTFGQESGEVFHVDLSSCEMPEPVRLYRIRPKRWESKSGFPSRDETSQALEALMRAFDLCPAHSPIQ